MKSLITKIKNHFKTHRNVWTRSAVVVAALVICSTHTAEAAVLDYFLKLGMDTVLETVAFLVNIALAISSWFVAFSGTLLNVSINLTMHIRDFINSTPAVYEVWKMIRDISGLFIIFTLLYAGIRMIVGLNAGMDGVIKNIVVAGIVINFSFFIAGLLIDASNVVSLQLYRAMTPGQPDIGQIISQGTQNGLSGAGSLPQIVTTAFRDGGLSAIFMQSLQIQNIYNARNLGLTGENAIGITTPMKIIVIGITGVMIMVTVGASFLFAAIAFVVRFIILLFLLAFSPIWCAAYVVPKLQEYAKEWWELFINQLIFMPVYLFLMYAAILMMTKSSLFKIGAYTNIWQGADLGLIPTEFMTLGINAALIVIMLNIPLLAALKLGAKSAGIVDGKNMGADVLWKKFGGFAGGVAGRATVGRLASAVDEELGNSRFGNKAWMRDLRSVTTGAVAKSKFGSSRSIEDVEKIDKDVEKRDKEIVNARALDTLVASGSTAAADYKTVLDKMNSKQKAGLDIKTLTSTNVLRHLKKDDFEAFKKPEGGLSDEDQETLKKARKKLFDDSVATAGTNAESKAIVKDMFKSWDTKDIAGMDASVLTNNHLIEHLTNEHMNAIKNGNLDAADLRTIAQTVINWDTTHGKGKKHRAYGPVNKHKDEWGM